MKSPLMVVRAGGGLERGSGGGCKVLAGQLKAKVSTAY